jgi:KaiC/GvpD/RAD55 family RecA-like ATPase
MWLVTMKESVRSVRESCRTTFEKDIAEAFDEGYQKALDALETFETEYTRKMAACLSC